jgi:cysteine-rich repeat protein
MALLLVCLGVGCGQVSATTDAASGTCGDGTVSGAEQCDEGSQNGTDGSCCSATCTFEASTKMCRAASGVCDQAESCTGSSGACPQDMTMPDGAACSGDGESACSAADTCQQGVCSNNEKAAGDRCSTSACTFEVCTGSGTCAVTPTQNIAIIESQSGPGGAGQNMDTVWKTLIEGLGHTATILPQTSLDNIANLTAYNVLIVSGFDIPIPAARRTVIKAFVQSGRGAYVQGEYLSTYEGNQVFLDVVNQLGAGFVFAADISGSLTVNATGCAASTPNTVPAMSQNYAATSTSSGNGIAALKVTTGGQAVAWRYCRAGGGLLIHTTDKDDIRSLTTGVPEYMKNELYMLIHASACTP